MSLLRRLEGGGGARLAAPPEAPARQDNKAPQPQAPTQQPPAPPPQRPAAPPPPAPERSAASSRDRNREKELKGRIQDRLIKEMDPKLDVTDQVKVRSQIKQLFDQILDDEGVLLPRADRERLFEGVAAEIVGLGPIEALLNDDSISEIMVNGPKTVFCERRGKLTLTDIEFDDDAHVKRIIERIVAPLGRRCDESSPYVDARLADGSRVHAIIPPLALNGPTVTIRKFPKKVMTIQNLIDFGSVTPELAEFLSAAVVSRFNIIVSGGTGSGKTSLLNVLSSFIPDEERIITVEDAAELQLMQEHWVRLETRKPNIEGKGAVTIRDLVMCTLRMRPDRVVIGECRGGEALDMIQAMNTGHDGSLTTLHANTPKDALGRLEVMVLMAGMDLPLRAIRQQVSSAVHLVIQQSRMQDGSRKVTYVTEIQGMEGDTIVTQDIFLFEQTGLAENGKIMGQMKPTGLRPKYMAKMEEHGVHLSPNIFGAQDRIFR